MNEDRNDILTLGRISFRNDNRLFGMENKARLSHLLILGQTGTGKTTLLECIVRQDISAGRGCFVIDPHGDLTQSLISWANRRRRKLTVLNPADTKATMGYNPIRRVPKPLRPLLASGILEVFKKLWGDSKGWGPKLEYLLRNALFTLIDIPDATLADIPALFRDKAYRRRIYSFISNHHVKKFWCEEYDQYSKRYINESIAPILNKVGGFITHPALDQFLNNSKKTISFRKAMDSGDTVIVNLAKGELGEDAANLLGSLLVTCIGLAAYSRADIPENQRKPSFLIVDEFQNFSSGSFINMSSELRKYGLGLTLATQFLKGVESDTRSAILGNFGSLISFRLGAEDSALIEQYLTPHFNQYDVLNLPNYQIYTQLLCGTKPSKPFSARTLLPVPSSE